MTPQSADTLRIRDLPLLKEASDEAFARLARAAAFQWIPRGATLTIEGEPCAALHILLEGAVELEGAWSDRGSTLALLRPPSTIVMSSVVLDAPALVTARATVRSRVLSIPAEAFRAVARADAGLAYAVAEELSGCYSGVVRTLKNHRLRGALERLAAYLLAQRQRQGVAETLRLPCQKRVLASLLGMTPENLSRAFAGLAPYGVEVDGARVTLRRPEALADLARPDRSLDNHARLDDAALHGQADRERLRYEALGST